MVLFTYLPKLAGNVGFPYKNLDKPYGAGIFFLYLHNHVSHKTNRLIWENFSKAPTKTFQYQLDQVAKNQDLSADSLFHDFAIWFQFWDGDDEFPASIKYLFDERALRYMHYETLWYAMHSLTDRLAYYA